MKHDLLAETVPAFYSYLEPITVEEARILEATKNRIFFERVLGEDPRPGWSTFSSMRFSAMVFVKDLSPIERGVFLGNLYAKLLSFAHVGSPHPPPVTYEQAIYLLQLALNAYGEHQ